MRMQSKELTKAQAIICRNGTWISEYFLRNSTQELEGYFLYYLEIEEENEVLELKGHSQLVHMRIRYHFIANLHITLHLKKRVWRRKWEAHVSKPRRIEVFPSQNSA